MASINIIRDRPLAYTLASGAVDLSVRYNRDTLLIKSLNIKGLVLQPGYADSAFFYFDSALHVIQRTGIRLEFPFLMYYFSSLYYEANDFNNSIILLDSAIRTGTALCKPAAVTAALISLGNIYLATEDYERARNMYDSSLSIALRNDLYRAAGVAFTNLAQFQQDPDSVFAYQKRAIACLQRQAGTEEELTNVEINLGLAHMHVDSSIHYYQRAIRKAEEYNLPVSLIAACNNLAYKLLKKGKTDEAERLIRDRAIPVAVELDHAEWISTLYDTYADILLKKPDYPEAIRYLRLSIEAAQEADRRVAGKQVRLLNAIFEVKNKDLAILEKERTINRQDIRIAWLYIGLLIATGLILIAAGGIVWIRRRSRLTLQKNKLEATQQILKAEEYEKEKLAMELHDSLGLFFSKMHATLQDTGAMDTQTQEVIRKQLRDFEQSIRMHSYRMNRKLLAKHSLESVLTGLFEDAIRYYHLNLVFEIQENFPETDEETAFQLLRITQELLANARKHAHAANIQFAVRFDNRNLTLICRDDGPGFNPSVQGEQNMGFSNIIARARSLSGTATVDAEPGFGVLWEIVVPYINKQT